MNIEKAINDARAELNKTIIPAVNRVGLYAAISDTYETEDELNAVIEFVRYYLAAYDLRVKEFHAHVNESGRFYVAFVAYSEEKIKRYEDRKILRYQIIKWGGVVLGVALACLVGGFDVNLLQ